MDFGYISVFFILLGLSILVNLKRRPAYYIFAFLAALFIVPIHRAMRNIGSDSFMEVQYFNFDEASFFLSTLESLDFYFKFTRFLNIILIFLTFTFLFKFLSKRIDLGKYKKFALLLIMLGLGLFLYMQFNSFKSNSVIFENISKNFIEIPTDRKSTEPHDQGVSLIVYIGESTSAMHMSIYDYPRLTTPNLKLLDDESDKFIKFNNVLSVHTHTTESLLESLSFEATKDVNRDLNFEDKKRISLINFFNFLGYETFLFSNQGSGGFNNFTSPIIFKNVKEKVSSNNNLIMGNDSERLSKPFDHSFFLKNLRSEGIDLEKGKKIFFLHSYAGHGPYLKNIPQRFKNRVDDYYDNKNVDQILRFPQESNLKNIEEYDSAIQYVDYSLVQIINLMDEISKPFIFIYFSDHGENVFNGMGHDSRRPEIETLAVPLIVYFNKSAYNEYPNLFNKIKEQSLSPHLNLLTQLPTLLSEIAGANEKDFNDIILFPNKFGSPQQNDRNEILVRKTNDGKKSIPINYNFSNDNYGTPFIGSYIYNRTTKLESDTKLCLHESNDFESIIRGKFVTNCLEFDLVIDGDNFDIFHFPIEKKSGLKISNLINKSTKNFSFWIDAKNLNNSDNCLKLFNFLKTNKLFYRDLLVEFPPETDLNDKKTLSCAQKMKDIGVEVSYYFDTDIGKRCLEKSNEDCNKISNQINIIQNNNIFNNVSYDKEILSLFRNLDIKKHNTWSLTPNEFHQIEINKFNNVIFSNSNKIKN